MTTLADMMLEVARHTTAIIGEGTATGGSTTTLIDTNDLTEINGYWTGGTLFLKSCTQTDLNGTVTPITKFGTNTVTVGTLSKTITAGDTYAVVDKEFNRLELKNAVLSVLRSRKVQQYDESLTVVSGQTEYTLPAGVKEIRRVMVDGIVNQHWHEVNGELTFPTKYAPASGTIQLIYCTPQGEITEIDDIHENYDYDWMKWTAVINLLRNKMNKIGKDEPILLDLLNEAKTQEKDASLRAKASIPTDMRLA